MGLALSTASAKEVPAREAEIPLYSEATEIAVTFAVCESPQHPLNNSQSGPKKAWNAKIQTNNRTNNSEHLEGTRHESVVL